MKSPCVKSQLKTLKPKITLENKVCQLVEHLKNNVNPRNEEIYLTPTHEFCMSSCYKI